MTPWERYVAEIKAIAESQKALERRRRYACGLLNEEQGMCEHKTVVDKHSIKVCENCGKGFEL